MPWIWLDNKRCLQTQHPLGLIHFTLFRNLILSYGISEQCFTINLHNYRTQQLLSARTTDKEVTKFLVLDAN